MTDLGSQSRRRSTLGIHPSAVAAVAGSIASIGLAVAPVSSWASQAVDGAPGVVVVSPQEILDYYTTVAPDGALLFTDRGGVTWRLIDDVDDPEITNPSVEGFFPMDTAEVLDALSALPMDFLLPADVPIFVLPFPRSGLLDSSADEHGIYLSPGMNPVPAETVHQVTTHEFGHIVHHRLLPDSDTKGWDDYRGLRGLEDDSVFHQAAAHAYRPHEIFAEDFRVLFGGALAAGDGSVENPELASPQYDSDLESFFLDLPLELLGSTASVSFARVETQWTVSPNPVPRNGRLELGAVGSRSDLDLVEESRANSERAELFDAQGRRVLTLPLVADGAGRWSVTLADLGLRPGTYWVRVGWSTGAKRVVVM